jgi:hypothetical protein
MLLWAWVFGNSPFPFSHVPKEPKTGNGGFYEMENDNGKKYLKITLGFQERKIRELSKGASNLLDFIF